ncbi:hypothetical protein B0T16DRAFT_397815 [Cercophora newfieldiana]|uniref:RNA-binding protein n=1 Tax=Cercophora newfieldiana TaxID=92897 RepID=A0AA40CY39_9PEZI|nr:hypothetical protein B0T16DRAFT_397815 [Cercophora newfieldiana]
MYEGYGSTSSRDGGYRRGTSPRRYDDSRDGDYRRSRKDHSHHPASRSTLDYDDQDDRDRGRYGTSYDGPEDRDAHLSRNARYEGGRSPAGGSRFSDNRAEGSRSRWSYGPPSKAIVLEDVPEDATERDVLYGLDYVTRDRHMSTDQVKVARLRHDHDGRRIAVVKFHRRSDAEYFMDRHYPEISFPLEHSRSIDSEPIVFRINFNRSNDETQPARDSRRDDEDWDCTRCGAINYPHRAVCYKCKLERLDYGFSTGPVLTGETDEDPQQIPSQYLVVRDLEGSVTEQVLANGVMKLFLDTSSERKDNTGSTNKLKSTAPIAGTAGLGAKPGSLRRVFLMRDRRTNESWRYGFAEFATVEDAMGAAAKFRASPRFTIASKPVFAAFIHTGVFVPVSGADSGGNPSFSFAPIYNPAVQLKYWDERAYPSVLVVSTDSASTAPSPDKSGAGDDVGKTTSKNVPGSKRPKKDKEPATGPKAIAMMPQMQMWAKKSAELHGVKKRQESDGVLTQENTEPPALVTIQREDLEEPQPDGPLNPYWTDDYVSYADWDRVACLLCDWEVPTQQAMEDQGYSQYRREDILIDHEVRVHNHYKDSEVKEKAVAKLSGLKKEPRTITRRAPRLRSAVPPVYVSYADFDALRCHLCGRNFKHVQTMWRHEQESELHKRMLTDPKNKERATAELKEKGKSPRTMVPDSKTTQQQNQYRDRARERRQAFNQPKQPSKSGTSGEKRKEPVAEAEEAPAKKSKGAGMLAKMGWTAGVGLGAEGTGRTEAIATDAYAPGVGLGAEGGKLGDATEEAARRTRDNPSDFVEKTRDRARERYERLEKP